jgi:hypothetical protein
VVQVQSGPGVTGPAWLTLRTVGRPGERRAHGDFRRRSHDAVGQRPCPGGVGDAFVPALRAAAPVRLILSFVPWNDRTGTGRCTGTPGERNPERGFWTPWIVLACAEDSGRCRIVNESG